MPLSLPVDGGGIAVSCFAQRWLDRLPETDTMAGAHDNKEM